MGLAKRGLLAGDLDAEPPPRKRRKKPVYVVTHSLKKLRDEGWLADVVERKIPHTFISKDLFGIGDILAVNEHLGVLIVQATDGTNVATRLRKIETEGLEAAVKCLRAGVLLHVHGWRKRGRRGEKKILTCRVVEARLEGDGIGWQEVVPDV